MSHALKRIKLDGSFSPAELGRRIGFDKLQSDAAARSLANQGVLIIGFDGAANFSPHYRKAHAPAILKIKSKKKLRHLPKEVAVG